MKKVEEEVASKQKWMEEKMQAQGKLASHLDPAVLTAKIVSEKEVKTSYPICLPVIIHSFVCLILLCVKLGTITSHFDYFLLLEPTKKL
jgi:hypothetical protein